MKQKTKFVLATFFKSLINNDAAIEGAKKAPWWMSIILFVCSIGLPLIPIAVNESKVKGSAYLGSVANGLDMQMTALSLDLQANKKTLEVSNGECVYKIDGVAKLNYDDADALTPIATYESTRNVEEKDENGVVTIKTLKQIELEMYYTSRVYDNKNELSAKTIIEDLIERKFVYGTENPKSAADATDTVYYTPSIVVFYKTGLYMINFAPDSTTKIGATTFLSDWKNTKDCELVSRTLKVEDVTKTTQQTHTNKTYVAGVYANWQKVFDESYLNAKSNRIGLQMLIYAGVYALIIIIMGFMLWLLTRGKNNPFNYLNFWITSKISCWASLAPAILGMIGGFIFVQYAGFAFIIVEGLRMMWLAMKNLRPAY
ncbi:MAG: hypothetical protein HUJ59_03995 [Bacilli bacterium]|nr:hypothetical protein [Bacilli bacterium]